MENYFLKAPEYSEPNNNSVLLRLENINDDERTIIYLVYKEGKISTRQVVNALKRSPGYCRNILNNLRNLNVLVWKGSSPKDPSQYYDYYFFVSIK